MNAFKPAWNWRTIAPAWTAFHTAFFLTNLFLNDPMNNIFEVINGAALIGGCAMAFVYDIGNIHGWRDGFREADLTWRRGLMSESHQVGGVTFRVWDKKPE